MRIVQFVGSVIFPAVLFAFVSAGSQVYGAPLYIFIFSILWYLGPVYFGFLIIEGLTYRKYGMKRFIEVSVISIAAFEIIAFLFNGPDYLELYLIPILVFVPYSLARASTE